MKPQDEKTISVLNDLVEICKDGQNGYQRASELIKDASYQTLFRQCSQERGRFASELKSDIRRLGGDPEKSGSVAGAVHRGWINIKGAVTGGDEGAIISECERGEDAAVEAYEKAMKEPLTPGTMALVQGQFRSIKKAHDRVRSLELQYKGS